MATPWSKMTDEQKARKRESARRYRMTAHGRAKRYESRKRWNDKNRERKRENDRKWYARKKEDAEWFSDKRAMVAKWREENAERYAESQRRWHGSHSHYFEEWRARRRRLWARNPEAYAEFRENARMWHQVNRKAGQGFYKPRPAQRIPDYLCYGQAACIKRRSAWLWENNSSERQAELNGYARELAINRKNRKK